MNNLCIIYKLKKTNFSNPHGLSDKNNRSTANDLAILTKEALNN